MSTSFSTRVPFTRSTWRVATGVITAAAMAMVIASPLTTPILLIGCLLMALFWVHYDGVREASSVSLPTVLGLGAVIVWFAVTMLWSSNRSAAAFAVALFAVALLVMARTPPLLEVLAADVKRIIAIGFVLGLGFGIWLMIEENASGFFLRRTFNSIVPMTRPHSITERLPNGWIAAMPSYVANKNTATAMVLMWTWMLVSKPLMRSPSLGILRYVTFLAAVIGIFLSDHETSKLAILLSALVFALTSSSRRAAFALVASLWVAATLLVIPVSSIAYKSGAYKIEQIQFSGRHRLVIWGSTVDSLLSRPLLGHGLGSTRVLDEMTPPDERRSVPGTDLPDGVNVHSHNVFVQAWHETGTIGGILIFLAGLPALAWLRACPDRSAPYMAASFVAALVLASLSWSLVASWYIGLFGFVAVWMRFADVWSRDGHADRAVLTTT